MAPDRSNADEAQARRGRLGHGRCGTRRGQPRATTGEQQQREARPCVGERAHGSAREGQAGWRGASVTAARRKGEEGGAHSRWRGAGAARRGGDGERGDERMRPMENNAGVAREEPVVLAGCSDGRRGAGRR